jgi:hypothetical protein
VGAGGDAPATAREAWQETRVWRAGADHKWHCVAVQRTALPEHAGEDAAEAGGKRARVARVWEAV